MPLAFTECPFYPQVFIPVIVEAFTSPLCPISRFKWFLGFPDRHGLKCPMPLSLTESDAKIHNISDFVRDPSGLLSDALDSHGAISPETTFLWQAKGSKPAVKYATT